MEFQKVSVDELKPDTGVITESDLLPFLASHSVKLTDEVQFPLTVKLTKRHALHIEQRASQRVTDTGLVGLYNWRVTENMVEQLKRE